MGYLTVSPRVILLLSLSSCCLLTMFHLPDLVLNHQTQADFHVDSVREKNIQRHNTFMKGYSKTLSKLITKWFTIKKEHLKDRLLNRHEYMFTLNSKLCLGLKHGILFVVHSSPWHLERRNLIRQTWCSEKLLMELPIACIFMLGDPNDTDLQKSMEEESRKFGDIVQGNFYDTYRNLTYKHVMALYWISQNCNDVRTIVKVDDDVTVNIYKLAQFSISKGHFELDNSIYCYVFEYGRPNRLDGKWLTPRDAYPFTFYPDYCAGLAYIMSAGEAIKLSEASEQTSFYWIDDVYVTGFLAIKSGIARKMFPWSRGVVMASQTYNESSVDINDTVFFHNFSEPIGLWERISEYYKGQV